MAKKSLLLAVFTSFFLYVLGQTPKAEWGLTLSSTEFESGRLTKCDNLGNVYLISVFKKAIDADPGPATKVFTPVGEYDVLVSKFDSKGNYVWAFQIGSQLNVNAYAIEVDDDDNLYISGTFRGKVDLDPSTVKYEFLDSSNTGQGSLYFAKYSPNGTFIWGKMYYGRYTGVAKNIVVRDNIMYICGAISKGVNFDFGPNKIIDGEGCFFAKYDTAANFFWVKMMPGVFEYQYVDLYYYYTPQLSWRNNNLYIAFSYFSPFLDLDPGPNIYIPFEVNSGGVAFAKYDTAGNLQWGKAINTNRSYYPKSSGIEVDKNENIYIVGDYFSRVDFDPGPDTFYINRPSLSQPDVFLAKYDSAGQPLWVNTITGNGYDMGFCIAIDSSANVYIAGTSDDTCYINSKSTTKQIVPAWRTQFLVKYDSSGYLKWDIFFCDKNVNKNVAGGWSYSISVNKKENLLWFTGDMRGEADLEPSPGITPLVGATAFSDFGDVFLVKYSQCYGIDSATSSVSYTPDTVICAGQPINFEVAGANWGTQPTFIWKKNGVIVETNKQIYTDSNLLNNDVITCELTSNASCLRQNKSVSTPVRITVLNNGNTHKDTSLCNLTETTLKSSISGKKYLWNTGDTISSIKALMSGHYWVKISNGSCDVYDSIKVSFNNLSFSLGNDTSICDGDQLILKTTYNTGTFVWNTGDTIKSINVNQSGIYILTIEDQGCSYSDSILLNVEEYPAFSIGNDTFICKNQSITLGIDPSPQIGYKILWNTGESSQSIVVNSEKTYSATVSNNNCSTTRNITLTILPLPQSNLIDNVEFCDVDSMTFSAGDINQKYQWSTGDTVPSITVVQPGKYLVSILNDFCSIKDSILVMECSDQDIYVPSAFSPNNDLHNDTFVIIIPPENIGDFKVFNRWGQIIYESGKTRNIISWDGTNNGHILSQDIYYYTLILKGRKIKAYKGAITLLR